MQEIITILIIVAALIFAVLKTVKAVKKIRNSNPCDGCRDSCSDCPLNETAQKKQD